MLWFLDFNVELRKKRSCLVPEGTQRNMPYRVAFKMSLITAIWLFPSVIWCNYFPNAYKEK